MHPRSIGAMTSFRLCLIAAFLAFAACASPPSAGSKTDDITILVSIDGFRADYLDRNATPTLSRLAAEGVRGSMRPSFPTVTFPNHYALVTGLTPDHNGLVGNAMEDATRPGVVFGISKRDIASDPIWWDDAEPIWVTARRQGVRVATMFWPGSDYVIRGQRPDLWLDFDKELPGFARVDQVLRWMDAPASERPKLVTLYFDLVDTAGHNYGPDAPETHSATAEVDAALTRLVDGLRARGLEQRANLVIVADHGMADISADRVISLDPLITPETALVLYAGPYAAISPLPGQTEVVERALLGRSAHGECWRKADMPARLGYGTHRRAPAIVCLADMGWRYHSTQLSKTPGADGGAHGFDPDAPEMAAIFIGHGPAFRRGVKLPSFRNVSVYPLLATLVGITPEPNDGALADTAPALSGN